VERLSLIVAWLLVAAIVVVFFGSQRTKQPTKNYDALAEKYGGTIHVPKGLTLETAAPSNQWEVVRTEPLPKSRGASNGVSEVPAGLVSSLPNGTELRKRRHTDGLGELTVENGTSFDAVVHLVDLNSEKTIRTFYVDTGSAFTERQIAPGAYGIFFATGSDWNTGLKTFNYSVNYSHFGRNMEFSETRQPDSGKIEYNTYQITLQPVQGGNATTDPSDKNVFDKLMNDGPTD
jgi:hypothetical protein